MMLNSGKRRHVVVGFADLSGSSEISANLEPELFADLMLALWHIFNSVVGRHGGEVIRIDGDGAEFFFDYSEGQEDAGRRSVEAALDMHAAVSALDPEYSIAGKSLQLHTGIHSGIVLLSPGNIDIGRHSLLGDTTNSAKRLCDLAAADQILVSNVTLGADIHFFRVAQQQVITVRGNRHKIAVANVTGRKGLTNRFDTRVSRGSAPFAGRQNEMRQLRQCLSEAADARLQVIVSGDPGIGKSRLLNEFSTLASAEGVSIHRGYCEAYLGARLFQPVSQIVHSLLTGEHGMPSDAGLPVTEKFVGKIDPRFSTALLQLLSFNAPGGDTKPPGVDDVADAVLALLESREPGSRIVLCVDDWQWADGGSKRVFESVFGRITGSCLIVLATREHDLLAANMSGARVIELNALGDDEARMAAESLVRVPVPFLVDRIVEQAGGNPLFIEEFCHFAAEDVDGSVQEMSSGSLESLIHSRFHKLPEDQADLVRVASVIGRMIPAWLFVQVTGVSLGDPVLAQLEEKDFIYTSETSADLRFKHGITRDAIYRIVGLRQRQAIHNRIVDALHDRARQTGEEEELEALSFHYRAGGNAVRAVQYATAAGNRAIAASSLDRAQAHYRSALEQIDFLGDSAQVVSQRNELVRKYGFACVVDPSPEQLEILRRATDKAAASNDNAALSWSEYWLGFILYGLGEVRRSIHHLEAARRAALSISDEKQIVQIHATLGQAHAAACEYEPALELLDQAIEIKRNHRSGVRSSIGLSYSLSCKAFVLADRGSFDVCYDYFDQAIDVLAGTEHEMTASVLLQRSASCLWQGDYAQAQECARKSLSITERVKARYPYAMSRALLAICDWEVSNDTKSLASLLEITNWLESMASQQSVSMNYGWLARGLASAGQNGLARKYAAKSLLRARKGDRFGEAMVYRFLARSAQHKGELQKAHRYLRKAVQSANARDSLHEQAKNFLCEAELRANESGSSSGQALASAVALFESLGMDVYRRRAESFRASAAG